MTNSNYLTWRPTWGGEHTIDEMGEELARSRAKRGGNRTVLTKLANEAHDLLKDEVLNRPRLKALAESLLEKLEIVKSLDEAILETCKVEDIELEIKEWYKKSSTSMQITPLYTPKTLNFCWIQKLTWELGFEPNLGWELGFGTPPSRPSTNVSSLANPKVKFRGEITQWQTFWDSFNNSIHVNPHLSPIDKFNHLYSLQEGQAARAIQGLTRTDANYQSAIEILQNRFGRPQNIISSHMDELPKIPGCTSDKAPQFRFVYDKINVNVRGLEYLGVSSSQYGSLLIP